MVTNVLVAMILIGTINKANAQAQSSIGFGFNTISLFRNYGNDSFFDGYSFSGWYKHNVANNTAAFIEVNALSAIGTNLRHWGLDRFLYTHTNLSLGLELNLVNRPANIVFVGIGGAVRNREEIQHEKAAEWEGEYLTADRYIKSWDYGALLKIGYTRMFSKGYQVSLVSSIATFNNEESVLSLGVEFGVNL